MNLHMNDHGGITYAPQQLVDEHDKRSPFLADLRMAIDALSETAEHHRSAQRNINALLDMLKPGAETDKLRADLLEDLGKIDAVLKFNDYIIARVRSGSFKLLAEKFDQ